MEEQTVKSRLYLPSHSDTAASEPWRCFLLFHQRTFIALLLWRLDNKRTFSRFLRSVEGLDVLLTLYSLLLPSLHPPPCYNQ